MTKGKKCNKCGEEKLLECFHNSSSSKDGKAYICRACKSETDRDYRRKNKDKIAKKKKEWATNNKERMDASHLKWRSKPENKKQISNYQKKNRKRINKYKLGWHHEKYCNDPFYRIKIEARRNIRTAFNNDTKTLDRSDTLEGLTFSMEDLINHLKTRGYTLEEYQQRDDLHIDHIIPFNYFVSLAKFKGKEFSREIIHRANSLENIRIVDEYSNLQKGSKVCIPLINKYKLHHLFT